MYAILIGALLLGCARADDDVQYLNVKSVKGGHRGHYYNPGANYPNLGSYDLRRNITQHGYGSQNASIYGVYNTSGKIDFEVGVCYIEVPTASLVRDPSHVPAGNGSRSDLSRIRTCCKGYIRNIYNFKICDPVCTKECVNGLCSAPDTCTCFPDHVRNLAGYCVPTCPIGCQNGHCSGGECLCKEGYKLDSESKFCIPICKENCGGLGNCTDSNICTCREGYQSTADGNCKPVCNHCINGDCLAPNVCNCRIGYSKNQQGQCIPQCPRGCEPNGRCVSPNVCEYPSTIRPTTQRHTYPASPSNRPIYSGNVTPRGDISQEERQPGNLNINNGTFTQDVPRKPIYPGNQVYPGYQGYPGNPGYPGNQVNPGNPQRYPGNQIYPDLQSLPGQQMYPGQQLYPGQPLYPGQQTYPGHQVYPGQQEYPGNPVNPVNPVNTENQARPGDQINQGNRGYPGNQVYPGNQMYPGYPGYQVNPGYQIYLGSQGYGNRGQYGYNGQFDVQSGHEISEVQGQTGSLDVQFAQQQSTQCSQQCINGACIGANTCQCKPGYVADANDPFRCLPNCPGGCPNGVCSAPNFCICNLGYYKDTSVKGRPACVKRIRRSVDSKEELDVAKLLIIDIPDY